MQDAAATMARHLAQDEEATRIYKLLTYVSEGTWAGGILSPSEAMIHRVLGQLLNQFSDLTLLRSHLHASVNTLNKPAEYSQIADTILETISLVRGSSDDPTTMFLDIVVPVPNHPTPLYTTMAAQLRQLPNQIRLKKLAFCAAQSIWEGDMIKLESMNWVELSKMVHQRHTTRKGLKKGLQQVVSRLSKPAEYSLLADTLIDNLDALYQVPIAETRASSADDLNLIPNVKTSRAESLADLEEANGDTHVCGPAPAAIVASPWGDDDMGKSIVEAIDCVVFDLHFDIMKLANPLRLKHLLLILVNSIEPEDAIESMTLRQQSTIPLLAVAFRSYRKPEILAIKLREIARKLPDPDEYETTIEAMMRAFKVRSSASTPDVGTTPKRIPA